MQAQDANIAALDSLFPAHPFHVLTLESDHSPFLSDPSALVEALSRALAVD